MKGPPPPASGPPDGESDAIALLERASDALEAGELDRAGDLVLEAFERLTGVEPDPLLPVPDLERVPPSARDLVAFGLVTLAWVDTERGDVEDALELVQRARSLAPDDPEACYLEAVLRLERWELARAAELLDACEGTDELRAAVTYQRAILAELAGELERADELYADAARRDPEGCPPPVRVADDEALALLDEVVASLPAEVRAGLDNVAIDLADLPDAELHGRDGLGPQILGLYSGTEIGERSAFDAVRYPDRILVFKRNLERIAHDRDHLREELRVTLLHEIGHHLGFDEEGVDDLGLA